MTQNDSEILLRPLLSPQDVERIQAGALRVLGHVGIRMLDEEARRILRDGGADVDETTATVRISERMVADALAIAPKQVQLHDRRGGVVSLPGDRPHLAPRDGKFDYWDCATGEVHRGTERNVADMARVADSLPGIDVNIASTYAWDGPQETVALRTLAALYRNTTKHCLVVPHDLPETRVAVELAKIACGSECLAGCSPISLVVSSTTPLVYADYVLQMILYAARESVPLIPMTGPVVGATGPITLAGNLALIAAETLAAVVLAQLVQPGLPVLFGSAPNILDMRTANVALGGRVERVLIYGATAQLARQYGLPAYAPSHMHTTVLGGRSPFQAGALRMLSYLNACLTGLDLTTGPGSMNGNSTVSPEQLLIDHDLWGISGRYLAGIRTDEESLALDAIERVGPGGHFLTDEHTLRWLRSDEHFYSRLFDPERLAAEGKTIYAQAHEQVEEILGRHRPAVPATAAAAIERYVGEWTARSGSRPAHAGPGSGEMEP